jgi:hypothetical protein
VLHILPQGMICGRGAAYHVLAIHSDFLTGAAKPESLDGWIASLHMRGSMIYLHA